MIAIPLIIVGVLMTISVVFIIPGIALTMLGGQIMVKPIKRYQSKQIDYYLRDRPMDRDEDEDASTPWEM